VVLRTPACATDPGSASIGGRFVPVSEMGCYRCELASAHDADGVDPEVIDAIGIAFARYPVELLRESGIQRIALCRIVESEGGPPRPEGPERIGGTVDLQAHRILFSLEGFIGRDYDPTDRFTGEDVLHHELFHLLEFTIDLSLALDDPEWRLLNAVDFSYHGQDHPTQPGLAGFVNEYATTNEAEDKASTFQYMMARPQELCALAAKDPLIAQKARRLWDRLARRIGDGFLRRRVDCLTYGPEKQEGIVRLGNRTTVVRDPELRTDDANR
jgi:hypothetical protein